MDAALSTDILWGVFLLNERRERALTRPREYKTDTNLALSPALARLLPMGVSQFDYPVGLILLETCQGRSNVRSSPVPPCWSPQSCDLCRRGFQSSYRSPAHMAALPNRCFSFAPLQSLSARRNGAKEVIHGAFFPFFFPRRCSPTTQTLLRMRPDSGLIGFLLLMTGI